MGSVLRSVLLTTFVSRNLGLRVVNRGCRIEGCSPFALCGRR